MSESDYSVFTDRELMEALVYRIDIIVAVLLIALAVSVAVFFCYIIYRTIMRFF